MGMFDRKPSGRAASPLVLGETRANLENPSVSLADAKAFSSVWGDGGQSNSGVNVTVEKALGVSAIWAAVNFISGTIASLPLQVFKRTDAGRVLDTSNPLYGILHDVVNDDLVTSFNWRKSMLTAILLDGGRSFTFIERNKAGRVMNFWPLQAKGMTVERLNGRVRYKYRDGTKESIFEPREILDIAFMMTGDGITHVSPMAALKDVVGLSISLNAYAAKFFQNGGVPPLALTGPAMSPAAAARASADVADSLKTAQKENKNVLVVPTGHELKAVGFNPEQSQLTEGRGFQILEVARIYSLPPVFLQDLSHGTFSNTEQQDLQFVKHTLTQWICALEAEFNTKLIGPRNRKSYIEFNLDGLLRGDFSTRMKGYAAGIQNAVLHPNEARRRENLPDDAEGDQLYIQGATIPLAAAQTLGKSKPDPQADPQTDETPDADDA